MSKRILTGKVVSTKMDKSAIVEVATAKKDIRYNKRYISHKRYCVHDEKNELKEGMNVVIEESRPLSKTKTWIIKEVISWYKRVLS